MTTRQHHFQPWAGTPTHANGIRDADTPPSAQMPYVRTRRARRGCTINLVVGGLRVVRSA